MTTVPRKSVLSLFVVLAAVSSGKTQDDDASPTPPADDPAAPASSSPSLSFRRVFLDADEAARRAKDSGMDYQRVKAEDFERLLRLVNNVAAAGAAAPARVVESTYEAQLVGEDVLAGTARLKIEHSGDGPTLLPLSPFHLAASKPRWQPRDQEQKEDAMWGVAEDGMFCLLVRGAGALEFDWSLRGAPESPHSERWKFNLALPRSPLRTLLLELPAERTAALPGGALVGKSPLPDGRRKWRLQLPGGDALSLLLARQTVEVQSRVAVRQTMTYLFTPRGLAVHARFALDVDQSPLRRLELQVGPGLRIRRVRHRNQAVSWSGAASAPNREKSVTLEFPQPLLGRGHVVTIRADAPISLGRPFSLPGVRAQNVRWQSGKANLQIGEPLSLLELSADHARLSSPVTRTVNAQGEARRKVDVQFFSPLARIELAVDHQDAPSRLTTAAELELRQRDVDGRLSVLVEQMAEGRFLLEADIVPLWSIGAVESHPPQALESWRTRTSGGQSVLEIHLAEGNSPSGLRLVITGRRFDPRGTPPQQAAESSLAWDELRMLRFHDAVVRRDLLALRAGAGMRVRPLESSSVRQLSAADLPTSEVALFRRPASALLFAADGPAPELAVALERPAAQYRVDVTSEITVAPTRLWESYTFRCIPRSAPVSEVVVQFSEARGQALQWTLAGGDDRLIQATKESAAKGEVWRLKLAQPFRAPFEIQAARAVPLEDGEPFSVSLAWAPDADPEAGLLRVRSMGDVGLLMENEGLRPVPAGAEVGASGLRGEFRYDPPDDAAAPSMRLAVAANPVVVGNCLVRRAVLHSRYTPSGNGWHTASFDIENYLRSSLSLSLPHNAGRLQVDVDGETVFSRRSGTQVEVPLPAGKRRLTLRLQFATLESPLGLWADVRAPAITPDVPVLQRQWIVSLPRSHAASALDQEWRPRQPQELSWPRRLFGLLARNGDQPPFDPLSWRDWRGLLGPRPQSTAILAHESDATDFTSWATQRFHGPPDSVPRIRIVHVAVISAAGWALAPLAALITLWLGRRAPRRLVPLLVIAGGFALLSPGVFVPAATGAVMGVLAGAVLIAIAPAAMRRPRRGRPRGSSAGRVSAALSLMLAAVLVAQGGRADTRNAANNVYDVLVPTQDAKSFYVPRELWEQLQRRAARLQRRPRGWLVQDVTYQLTSLVRDAARPGAFTIKDEVTARFNLHVFHPDTAVRLDFGDSDPLARPREAVLDGREVAVRWEQEGRYLVVDVAAAGARSLEVAFLVRPKPRSDGRRGIATSIPAVPSTRFRFGLPAEAPQVRLPSAVGQVKAIGGRTVDAALGPARRLALDWADGTEEAKPPVFDSNELLWLDVRPGSVVLRGKFSFQVAAATRELRLLADSSLQLQDGFRPANEQHAITVKQAPAAGGATRYVLSFQRPVSGPVAVEADFRLRDATGVGNLWLPLCRAEGVRSARRRIAVNVDPLLELEADGPDEAALEPAKEFLQDWGDDEKTPQRVYRQPGDGPAWRFATHPRTAVKKVRQSLAVSIGPRAARWVFSADVSISGASFQHRVPVPPGVRVEEVTLTDGDSERSTPRRVVWTRGGAFVSVFLPEAAAARQHLRLRGTMPVKLGAWQAPRIQLEEAETESDQLLFYRQPGVQLRPTGRTQLSSAGVDELEPSAAPSDPGRFVGGVKRTASTPRVAFRVSANELRFGRRQMQLTALLREQGTWKAEIQLQLNVQRGQLDSITWIVPKALGEPSAVQPPGRFETLDAAGVFRRLQYIPHTPIGPGETLVTWVAALPGGEAASVAAPNVRPRDVPSPARYLVLPASEDGRPIEWRTEDLAGVDDLPRPNPFSWSYPVAPHIFRVGRDGKGPRFQARLRPHAASPVVARVLAAQYQLAWIDDVCHGEVQFDFRPAGKKECLLELPAAFSLVRVLIDGLPAIVRPEKDAEDAPRWRLASASQDMPQRISVNFSGKIAAGGEAQLPQARLDRIEPERTVWTLLPPAGAQVQLPDGAQPLPAAGHQLDRLRAVSGVITGHARSAAKGDLRRWYRPWAQRLAELLFTVERAGDRDTSTTTAADSIRDAQRKLAEELGVVELLDRYLRATERESSAPDEATIDPPGAVRFALAAGHEATIVLQTDRPRGLVGRLAVLCALSLGLILFARLVVAWDLARRWPHWLAVAAGTLWWLWFWPSILGLVLIALALAGLATGAAGRRAAHRKSDH